MTTPGQLTALQPGQLIPFGGDRVAVVSDDLASQFVAGDRLVVVQATGALLHISAAEHELAADAVGAATRAFAQLANVDDDRITEFYDGFAAKLAADDSFAPIQEANDTDVATARTRGRSVTRLVLSASMRESMVMGLCAWRDSLSRRERVAELIEHSGWSVVARHAPLGVVGFVFEGRPNVLADATGVIRTGNTAVLRIGSDALGTARAIMQHALWPALRETGLPEGAVALIDSPSRAAGWALFGDTRLAVAVARGSGQAVAQLGAVARQGGIPVSLHGAGGAWMMASAAADEGRFRKSVANSIDRKVCNTLNVCCVVTSRAATLVPAFVHTLRDTAARRGVPARLHLTERARAFAEPGWFDEIVAVTRPGGISHEPFVDVIATSQLATEWEWESSPEVTLAVVESLGEAVELFNTLSPRLAASLISEDAAEHTWFYNACDAPFIGDGMTRWVDGQFALNRPELGLSNWEGGRLLARSAVLSGDSVYTVRLRAQIADGSLRR